jgi:hypothetical protein
MSYDINLQVLSRLHLDWSDPDNVKEGHCFDLTRVKLVNVQTFHHDQKAISVTVKHPAGTHFRSVGEQAYHSPRMVVYIVLEPKKKTGWGYEVASWEVKRKRK